MSEAVLAGTIMAPGGTLAVVARADGVVLAAGYTALDALVDRWSATGPASQHRAAVELQDGVPAHVASAVAAYADGDVDALGRVAVQQTGPPFLQQVWSALRGVPAGRTVTYTELAARAGRPAAVRAAASGCARNLVAPFVPCHRIVRGDGAMGGYAYGVDVKRALLRHEGSVPSSEAVRAER